MLKKRIDLSTLGQLCPGTDTGKQNCISTVDADSGRSAILDAPTPTRFLLECGEYPLTTSMTFSEINPFEASFALSSGLNRDGPLHTGLTPNACSVTIPSTPAPAVAADTTLYTSNGDKRLASSDFRDELRPKVALPNRSTTFFKPASIDVTTPVASLPLVDSTDTCTNENFKDSKKIREAVLNAEASFGGTITQEDIAVINRPRLREARILGRGPKRTMVSCNETPFGSGDTGALDIPEGGASFREVNYGLQAAPLANFKVITKDSPKEPDGDRRRERFLERNRKAASRCRQKKRLLQQRLEEQAEESIKHNANLQLWLTQLREQVVLLRNQMLAHRNCNCSYVQQYLRNITQPIPPK